jgi:hypothetical protein
MADLPAGLLGGSLARPLATAGKTLAKPARIAI